MKQEDVIKLGKNFFETFKMLEKQDFLSLKPFKDRYQATLVLMGYATVTPFLPSVLEATLAVFEPFSNALGICCFIYSAFQFLKYANLQNHRNTETEQKECVKQAVTSFFISMSLAIARFLLIFAHQFLSPLMIILAGIRLFSALPDKNGFSVNIEFS